MVIKQTLSETLMMKRSRNAIAPSIAQRALGIFVIWQLCLLTVVTILDNTPGQICQPVQRLFRPWQELTHQWQGWGFFTGWVTRRAAFPVVEFRWPGGCERVYSTFEPGDPTYYFHPVFQSHRRYNYEWKLVKHQAMIGDSVYTSAAPESWRKYMNEVLEVHGESMISFLRWHLYHYRRAHPDGPLPQEVILKVRVYSPRPAGSGNLEHTPITDRLVACWRPNSEPPPAFWPMEVYVPLTGHFERFINAAHK